MKQKDQGIKYLLINLSKNVEFQPKDTNRMFERDYKLTIGLEIHNAKYLIGNQKVKVQFWELGLQERFRYVRQTFYKDALGAVILSSISNEAEFQNVENIVKEIFQFQNVPILIFNAGDSSQFFDKIYAGGSRISKFKIGKESQGLIKEEIKKSIKILLTKLEVSQPESNVIGYDFLQDDF